MCVHQVLLDQMTHPTFVFFCFFRFVCPPGSARPNDPSDACPPGTLSNRTDLTALSQCQQCPARYACLRGAKLPSEPFCFCKFSALQFLLYRHWWRPEASDFLLSWTLLSCGHYVPHSAQVSSWYLEWPQWTGVGAWVPVVPERLVLFSRSGVSLWEMQLGTLLSWRY